METLEFKGNGKEYFSIWIVNILLTIVTLSLYYPWAKVRNRRYFYANSEFEGRNFEYHATGKQLFLGYLIGLGLLLIYVISTNTLPTVGGIVLLIFVLGLPWIIWRSLQFNLRMTSFSNVRFSFNGDLGGAYFAYLILPFLVFFVFYGGLAAAILLGVSSSNKDLGQFWGFLIGIGTVIGSLYLYGVLKKRSTTYTLNGTHFGQGIFNANVQAQPFMVIAIKTALVGLAVFFLAGFIAAISASLFIGAEQFAAFEASLEDSDSAWQILMSDGAAYIGAVYLLFFLASFVVLAYSQSRMRRYIFANTTLDESVSFVSIVRARPLAWIMITNLLLMIVTLGLGIPWAKVRIARYFLENTQVDAKQGFDHFITQKIDEQSALGDQIGDVFDVDVGIGL